MGERRAVIYRRISRDETGDAAGVARQAVDCRRYCDQRGWAVVADLEDNDISASAYTRKRRPAYTQALHLVESGQADAIVAWHLDRLWRRPAELEHLIDLAEHRHVVVATLNGDIDLSTGDGRFLARILVSVAAKASDDSSRRIRRRAEDDAAAGRPHGPRAFGWAPDRSTLDPAEAPIVADLAARYLAGESMHSLAADLNARGVRSPQGARHGWTGTTVRTVLTNPRLTGLRTHRGDIVGPGLWEPIVDRVTHERLVATVAAGATAPPSRRRLLTGLVVCGRCHRRLVYDRRSMACIGGPGRSGCGRLAVAVDPLEALVVAEVLARAATARAEPVAAGEDWTAAAASIEGRLAELGTLWGERRISRAEWMAARRPLDEQMVRARRAARPSGGPVDVTAFLGAGDGAAGRWPSLSLDQQRAVLAAYVERVEVAPAARRGPGMDPERVTVVWQ